MTTIEDMEAFASAKIPILLLGPPGCGKTALGFALAAKLGLPAVHIALPLWDAVDLRGMPCVVDGRTKWLPPAALPGAPSVIILDEIASAPPLVQVAALSWLQFGTIGEYANPPGSIMVGTGNRVEDKAGAGRLSTAVLNRCAVITVLPSLREWSEWALRAGIHPLILAHLRLVPAALHDWDPLRPVNATPRTWELVSRLLSAGNPTVSQMSALIGEGRAAELAATIKLANQVPKPETIFGSPDTAPVPVDPGALYAVTAMLGHYATRQDALALVTYVDRLPGDWRALTGRDLMARASEVTNTREWLAWTAKNSDLFI